MTFYQLGESDKVFSLGEHAFVMENVLGIFLKDSSFLLLSRTMRESFSDLHQLVKLTEVSEIPG